MHIHCLLTLNVHCVCSASVCTCMLLICVIIVMYIYMYGVFKCVGAFTHNVFLIMIIAPTTPTSRMRWNYPSLSNGKGSVMIERQEGEEETTFVIREGNFLYCVFSHKFSLFLSYSSSTVLVSLLFPCPTAISLYMYMCIFIFALLQVIKMH